MSNQAVHVYRMVHAETEHFAASDVLVACLDASESEARTRAGWGAMSPAGEESIEYLGPMSGAEYDAARAEHTARAR